MKGAPENNTMSRKRDWDFRVRQLREPDEKSSTKQHVECRKRLEPTFTVIDIFDNRKRNKI